MSVAFAVPVHPAKDAQAAAFFATYKLFRPNITMQFVFSTQSDRDSSKLQEAGAPSFVLPQALYDRWNEHHTNWPSSKKFYAVDRLCSNPEVEYVVTMDVDTGILQVLYIYTWPHGDMLVLMASAECEDLSGRLIPTMVV